MARDAYHSNSNKAPAPLDRSVSQAEDALQKLRRNISEEDAATKMDRVAVEKQQLELDRLAATLKQVEAYNENMKGEIAVTRRAAYAVEGAVTALEKEKMEQDFRVDTLQGQHPIRMLLAAWLQAFMVPTSSVVVQGSLTSTALHPRPRTGCPENKARAQILVAF
eukprot:1158016-Pelagomonas_calceolata.AAC.5